MPAKSMARIKEKWTRVTPQRTQDYTLGIEQPRVDWATAAAAAKETHKAAMTAAAAADSYGKGVIRVGTEKWKDKAKKKGPTRFAEGVMIGGDDYEKGFAPYRDEIDKVVPPPRFPRRDPRNLLRVGAYTTALAKKKTA